MTKELNLCLPKNNSCLVVRAGLEPATSGFQVRRPNHSPMLPPVICYLNVNLFTHGTPRSSQELVQKCPCIPGSNWNLEMLVFEERGKPLSTRRKTSWSRVENQQETQPTYDAGSGNRTRDTLVGGERSAP